MKQTKITSVECRQRVVYIYCTYMYSYLLSVLFGLFPAGAWSISFYISNFSPWSWWDVLEVVSQPMAVHSVSWKTRQCTVFSRYGISSSFFFFLALLFSSYFLQPGLCEVYAKGITNKKSSNFSRCIYVHNFQNVFSTWMVAYHDLSFTPVWVV